MREALYKMIRFWADKGVGGFRLDVIDQIAKVPDEKITANGPRLHEFLRELSEKAFVRNGLVSVGEAWGANVERAKQFSAPDGSELSMVFQFEHICLDQKPGGEKWDTIPLRLPSLKQCFERWQTGLHNCGWNSLFLDNHDLPRIVSRWGNDNEYRVASAKMLAVMLHGMQGTPYIYQGEELGMTNIRLPIEKYVDLEIRNVYQERLARGIPEGEILQSIYARGRDNARTPMQWTNGENAGFTTGIPWLSVNPNYNEINAEEALQNPASTFYFYQKLIALRKQYPVFRDGSFNLLLPEDEKIFAYTRDTEQEHLLIICNFTAGSIPFDRPKEFESAELLLSNYEAESNELRPYEAQIFYRNEGQS